MISSKISGPKPAPHLDEIAGSALRPSATLRNFQLKQAVLPGLIAPSLDLDEGLIESVELSGAKLTKLLANDIVFKRCGLANADCSESSFIRAQFSDNRMTGWDANMASFEDVAIKDCKLDMANFRSAKFTRVRFENCILTDADFLAAELEDVEFQDCLLEKTQFSQCKMKSVDFRGSQLIDISGWASLKGATIDSVQLASAAPYLAAELGIKVQD